MSAIAAALGRPLGAVRGMSLSLSPRARHGLIALAAACVVLAAAYFGWFRDSGLVSVDRVTVSGITARDAGKLRAALTERARTMTTLHVDRDQLEQVVAGYPVVRELRVTPDFPHGLHIAVVEHHPAALAVAGTARVPVAGDGTVLRGLPVDGELPELRLRGAIPAERLSEPVALRDARVLGGAPRPLRPRLEGVRTGGPKGLTVKMREGPQLIFGDTSRLRAKWLAATRVLADPSARGATYIDLRLPDRPAAGGVAAATLEPVAPSAGPAAPGAQAEGVPGPQAAPPAPSQQPQQPEPTPAQQAPPPGAPQPAPQPQGGSGGGATANPQP